MCFLFRRCMQWYFSRRQSPVTTMRGVSNPRLITLRCSQSDEWRVSGRDQSRIIDNCYRPASSIKDSRSKYAILENTEYLLTTWLQMGEWLFFNTNSAIFQLYRGENKLIFNEMTKPKTIQLVYVASPLSIHQ